MLCFNDGDIPFKYIIHVLLTIASGFFNSWELNSDEGCVRCEVLILLSDFASKQYLLQHEHIL